MIKKEKKVSFSVIEKDELEKAVSKHFGTEIKVSDMEVGLFDCVPLFDMKPEGFYFNITIPEKGLDDNFTDSFDLAEENNWPEDFGTIAFTEEEYVFDFDVSEFKAYERNIDTSD